MPTPGRSGRPELSGNASGRQPSGRRSVVDARPASWIAAVTIARDSSRASLSQMKMNSKDRSLRASLSRSSARNQTLASISPPSVMGMRISCLKGAHEGRREHEAAQDAAIRGIGQVEKPRPDPEQRPVRLPAQNRGNRQPARAAPRFQNLARLDLDRLVRPPQHPRSRAPLPPSPRSAPRPRPHALGNRPNRGETTAECPTRPRIAQRRRRCR